MKPLAMLANAAIVAALLPATAAAIAGQEAQSSAPIVTERTRIARPPQAEPNCAGLPAPPALPLYLLGLHEAASLSTAWLGNADEETHVVDIHVEPGPPLHLLISNSDRIIVRFSGATPRIGQLTLMTQQAVGAIGIAADRIRFAPSCIAEGWLRESTWAEAAALAARVFPGREVAAVAGDYEAQFIRIGQDIRIQQGFRPDLRADPETNTLYSFSPGGISPVDFRAVVSTVPVGPYRTLPQEAGVRQLMMSGALVRATEADARRWEASARARGQVDARAVYGLSYGIYRVTRPIVVPAGLCGSHSIRLYAPSLSFIQGDPCHSTIYLDDGTESDPFSRARAREASPPPAGD